MQKNKQRDLYIGGVALLLFLDVTFKKLALASPTVATLCNDGAFLGIFAFKDLPWMIPVVTFIVVVLVADLAGRAYRLGCSELFVGWTLIFIGGIGNLIDRVYYGCVIDYIPFFGISHINLADVYISIGALVVLFYAKNGSGREV